MRSRHNLLSFPKLAVVRAGLCKLARAYALSFTSSKEDQAIALRYRMCFCEF